MKAGRPRFDPRALVCAAALVLPTSAALGQTLPAGQVPGSQLQLWLDQKVSYAGIHHASGCYFMNSAASQGRVLFMSCPNGWTGKIDGTVRVAGDTFCTNFAVPGEPPGEECVTWHAKGDRAFEQRKLGVLSTSLTVLSNVPMGNR